MSIIKKPAAPPKIATIEVQLEEPLLTTLKAYCKFIDSTPDHVTATALRLVFKKDYEFKRWLKAQKESQKPLAEDKQNRTQGSATPVQP
ncbi:MAG TPA: hypothetical protein VNE63_02115 [Candidatus Acidoferrales bacterium]|nr:hypothetical protein [Candidatus Acidoferrales bacterium]